MGASVVMIASLTVNLCVLLALVISWILRRRRIAEKRRQLARSPSEEPELDIRTPVRVIVRRSKTASKAEKVFVISDVITSSFCFVAGLYIVASPALRRCPFAFHHDINCWSDSSVRPGFGDATSAVLSISLGSFVFALVHLMFACCRSSSWTLRFILRSGYLFVNIVSISLIIATGENLLGAGLILLMEVDDVIEAICQILDRCTSRIQVQRFRIMLSILGCAASCGIRIILTWVMTILLGHNSNPVAMSALSLSIASFAFIFYQAYTLLVVKRHLDRIKYLLHGETPATPDSGTVQSYHRKRSGAPFRKDMAFYMMNEGLLEISNYAKTVAGAIKEKKLLPIYKIQENLTSFKPGDRDGSPKMLK